MRILIDCGSPDWAPEPSPFEPANSEDAQTSHPWTEYTEELERYGSYHNVTVLQRAHIIARIAPTIDLVLLSHGDLAHCGLYAWAHARWGLKAPAYSTLPVQAMGRIAVTEDVEGLREEEEVNDQPASTESSGDDREKMEGASPSPPPKPSTGKFIATVIEVQDAFDSLNTLRYSQPTHLQGNVISCQSFLFALLILIAGKCQGLTITPFNAGHTLGGTIWKIRSPSSGTIVYAVNVNHMRERHLDGTVLMRQATGGVFEALARPDLLITDADRVPIVTSRRKDREPALIGV